MVEALELSLNEIGVLLLIASSIPVPVARPTVRLIEELLFLFQSPLNVIEIVTVLPSLMFVSLQEFKREWYGPAGHCCNYGESNTGLFSILASGCRLSIGKSRTGEGLSRLTFPEKSSVSSRNPPPSDKVRSGLRWW